MRVAVIDVGSNSIKLLVAERDAAGALAEVDSRVLEVRIGGGLGSERPRLGAEALARAADAVALLAAEARGLGAGRLLVAATSAVREAENAGDFLERVRAATGVGVRVLSGGEEAALIGRGLATDPALGELRDFHVYDLGGGSLECLAFRDRRVGRAVSLPLGCVRLTERFVARPAEPFTAASAAAIRTHVREVLLGSGFELPVPRGFAVVGTGGTLASVRAIDAAARGVAFGDAGPEVGAGLLARQLEDLGRLGLEERRRVPGLPPSRADVFPAALATLLALAELGSIRAFRHSLRNLRWGLAAECL